MSGTSLTLAGVRADIQAQARSRAEQSLRAFGRLYLRHHLERPPSQMHR